MVSIRKVKCPYCSYSNTKEKVINHIELKHEDMIPQGFTAARVLFNHINKKDHGTCVICKGNTTWNEKTNKYNRLCNKPECKNKLREMYKKNMLKVYGKTTLLNDPEQQKKMLANRSISGIYKFTNGKVKEYTGSFEKKFLVFMDTIMGYDPDDIIMPGPTLEYEYKGEKHQWITDALIVPYNLIIEIKDGGDFKNNRSMVSYREKQVAKEEMITNMGKYNYLRLTNNQFGQLIDILYELKMQMIDDSDDNKKAIVKIHEGFLDDLKGTFTSTNKKITYKDDEYKIVYILEKNFKDKNYNKKLPAFNKSEIDRYWLYGAIKKQVPNSGYNDQKDLVVMPESVWNKYKDEKILVFEINKSECTKINTSAGALNSVVAKLGSFDVHYTVDKNKLKKKIMSISVRDIIKKSGYKLTTLWNGPFKPGKPININESSQPIFISEDDLEIKLDDWKDGKIKCLFIAGMSGGGKSTLANNLAKEYGAIMIEMDLIMWFLKVGKSMPVEPPYKLIEWHKYKTHKPYPDDKEMERISTDKDFKKNMICDYLEWVIQKSPKQFVIEGPIDDIVKYRPNLLEEGALIVKGTSTFTSVIRRIKRDFTRTDRPMDGLGIKYLYKVLFKDYPKYQKDMNYVRDYVDNYTESSQPLLISEKDVEYRLDDFKNHKVPVLWITGLSGGGKSTIAKKISEEMKCERFCIDDIEGFIKLFIKNDNKTMEGWIYTNPNFKVIQDYLKKNPDTGYQEDDNKWNKFESNVIELIAKKHSNFNQIIIEGVQIPTIFRYKKSIFNNSAIIIKGTSITTSIIRRIKRDQKRGEFINNFEDIGFYMKEYYNMYKGQNNFRDKAIKESSDSIKTITETSKIIEKVKEYEEYIKEHIQNVRNSYNTRKSKIQLVLGLSEGDMQELENRIKNHDNSKWSNDEFDAYRRHFHSVSDKEKEDSEEDFKKAWKHHYTVNDHHPEYWKNTDMPNIAIAELICDWEAMSRKFGGNPLEYFEKNKAELKAKMNEYSYNAIYNALKNIYDIKTNLKESVNNEDFFNPKMLNFKFDKDIYINYDKPNKVYKCYPYAFYEFNLPRLKIDPLIMNENKKLAIYGCFYLMTKGFTGSNIFKPLEVRKTWWDKHKRDKVYWIESKKYHEYKGQLIVDGTNKNNYKAIVTTLDKIIHTECKDSVKLIII